MAGTVLTGRVLGFVWSISFVWLKETNQMNQINQKNQINRFRLLRNQELQFRSPL